MALTPGFLRSERVLEHFGVSEANWKEAGKRKDAHLNSKNQNDGALYARYGFEYLILCHAVSHVLAVSFA